MAPLCALGRCCPRSDGQAVRAPRHGAYRLRHDPVLLALRESVRHLRQHFRHRRYASTPNAVAIIAGQSGDTQWVKHPSETQDAAQDSLTAPVSGTINGETYSGTATTLGPPLVEDPQPWWGSEFDATVAGREPAGAPQKEWYKSNNIASNLTFATLPHVHGRLDQLVHGPGSQSGFRPPRRDEGHSLHRRNRRRARPMAVVPERLRP